MPTKKSQAKLSQKERPWSIFGHRKNEIKDSKLTHASLFAGCGGFDLGFTQAGFKTVFANDIDEDASETYRHNLGELITGDIRQIDFPKFRKRLDVLTAGFPCQPFSNAGSRRGLEDNRGTLYEAAIRAVEHFNPKVVLFENVRGLLSFGAGKDLLVGRICENLKDLGYQVSFRLIDASNHNVPQRRLRLFIAGVSDSGNVGTFSFPTSIERDDLTLRDTIYDIPNNTPNQKELMQLNPQAIKIGAMVPEGGSWKDIPYEKLPDRLKKIADDMAKYRWPNFYRRFSRKEIAGTITAAFKPENAGVWHPTRKRIFSVREIARIQTFPDWFEFFGRNTKCKYSQIGNAVPPRLAYEFALCAAGALSRQVTEQNKPRLYYSEFIKKRKPLRASDSEVIYSPEPMLF